MREKMLKRAITSVLTLVMAFSLLPSTTFAAGETSTLAEDNDGLVLNKTATLEDDGTYTIKLEAYATGEVTTTTTVEHEPVPADIILILDESGSMDFSMTGIPSDTYDAATVTNANINSGRYYYLASDGQYYRVTATKEIVSSSMEYLGDDGKIYQASELSTSWTRKSDGMVYNTARPFVASSLSTYTRTHSGKYIQTFWYVNDENSNDSSDKALSAKNARSNFSNKYDVNPYTVEFHNDGAPGNDTSADDPYYVAAQYIAVTRQEVNQVRYTYTYVDETGRTITIGTSETGAETVIDNANASIDLYVQATTTGTRLDGLKYAVNEFVDSIEATGVNHRIAVVGFASNDNSNWTNTELFVGATQYNYNNGAAGNVYAAAHYKDALQDVSTDTGKANINASIDNLAAEGATYPQSGFTMAQGIFDASDSTYTMADGTEGTRNRIVIFFTDGYPGQNEKDPSTTEANATITKANTLKQTYGADVYCVACIESIPSGSDADTYLKNVSSGNTYQQATSAEALSSFFETVEHEVTDTTTETSVTLTDRAVLVDELSNYFTVPTDFSIENNVTLQTAEHKGFESFAEPVAAPDTVTASLRTNPNGNVTGIDVAGFDYISKNNMVVTTDNGGASVSADGNKLIVTIKGLLAKDTAATGVYIETNTSNAGIWDKDNNDQWAKIKAFNMPITLLDKKLFVMDYAKTASLGVYNATRIDNAEDEVFDKVGETSTSLAGNYGIASAENGLTYSPKTTNWDGWDTFYALGKDADKGDKTTQNIWAKVSVLPANNVYYEDTFITDSSAGRVGIEYTGEWNTVTEGPNAGDVNGDEHGWITSMDNDIAYSDGTAAVGSENATAQFTFTGTGVDIYSRTNMTTGLVIARLYEGEQVNKSSLTKSLTVDNLAQSGDYYQIPTVSFCGLDHGTYTVKLTVVSTTNVTDSERSTYYLDGIRVYNPLSDEQETDQTVQDAYGDEINATFIEIRDILLDSESLGDDEENEGAVFIDYNPDTETEGDTATTSTIGTYKEYGPKNEVYLAKNQAIAIPVGDQIKVSVGLKAPNGTTTAEVTNGEARSEIDVKGASDQYYAVEPNNEGYVIIKNTTENLLSVTKLKMSGESISSAGSFSLNVASVMSYAESFDSLPVKAYSLVDEEETSDQTSESVTDESKEDQENQEGNVIIENPDDDQKEEDVPTISDSWINKLINSIRKIIGRR